MVKDLLQQRHVVVAESWSPFEVLMHHELPSQPFWLLHLFPAFFLHSFSCIPDPFSCKSTLAQSRIESKRHFVSSINLCAQ